MERFKKINEKINLPQAGNFEKGLKDFQDTSVKDKFLNLMNPSPSPSPTQGYADGGEIEFDPNDDFTVETHPVPENERVPVPAPTPRPDDGMQVVLRKISKNRHYAEGGLVDGDNSQAPPSDDINSKLAAIAKMGQPPGYQPSADDMQRYNMALGSGTAAGTISKVGLPVAGQLYQQLSHPDAIMDVVKQIPKTAENMPKIQALLQKAYGKVTVK